MKIPKLHRFNDKFIISKTNFYNGTACWDWIAHIDYRGYGTFTFNGKLTGGISRKGFAHRYSYETLVGPISEGLIILHLCKSKCVNPLHLKVGTQTENMRQRMTDGTTNKGKTYVKSKRL